MGPRRVAAMEEGNSQAGRGGEEWCDPEFLGRLRALFLRLRRRRRRRRVVSQAPAATFTREFRDYRAYSINDDFRSVDWRVYARLGRLFVRQFEPAQEYQVHLLIDASASMERPYGEKSRNVLRLAVALSYLGLVGQHRVSVSVMKDRVASLVPPIKGQGSIHRVIDSLRRLEFGGVTNLRACLEAFRPGRQRDAVVFVLSDLLAHEPGAAEEALRRAGSWPGETHVIQILDPREREPGGEGELLFRDAETGEERRFWMTREDQQRYRKLFDGFLEGVERTCARRQVDYQLWMTDRELEDFFTGLMDRGSVLGGRD